MVKIPEGNIFVKYLLLSLSTKKEIGGWFEFVLNLYTNTIDSINVGKLETLNTIKRRKTPQLCFVYRYIGSRCKSKQHWRLLSFSITKSLQSSFEVTSVYPNSHHNHQQNHCTYIITNCQSSRSLFMKRSLNFSWMEAPATDRNNPQNTWSCEWTRSLSTIPNQSHLSYQYLWTWSCRMNDQWP